MDITLKKLSLIKWITEIEDDVVISKIEELKELDSSKKNEAVLSINELIARHKRSEEDINSSRTIKQEELNAFFKNKING